MFIASSRNLGLRNYVCVEKKKMLYLYSSIFIFTIMHLNTYLLKLVGVFGLKYNKC